MHQKVDTRIRLALIYGSSREGRFCDKVAGWAISQIAGDGPFDLAVVDPGEIDLPPRHVSGKHPALEELRNIIGWADGFVV
ncbi:MAG: NAD(P)H-dependent oxidoreductase, partial [Proteobacteria bacterium]|nr:NAD(P)H-dependent oxidoreductase [Pseudomonadota bacterium]